MHGLVLGLDFIRISWKRWFAVVQSRVKMNLTNILCAYWFFQCKQARLETEEVYLLEAWIERNNSKHAHTHTHTHTRTRTHTQTHTCACACMHARTCLCVHTHARARTHTHTHTHTNKRPLLLQERVHNSCTRHERRTRQTQTVGDTDTDSETESEKAQRNVHMCTHWKYISMSTWNYNL